MTTKEVIEQVHYAGDSGDGIKPQDTAQDLNDTVRQTRIETSVSLDVTDVSMTSPSPRGDTSSVNMKPTSTPGDVSDSNSESDDVDEELLPLVTNQPVAEVTMATVTGRGKDVEGISWEERLMEDAEKSEGVTDEMTTEGTTEDRTTDLATRSTSDVQVIMIIMQTRRHPRWSGRLASVRVSWRK